MKGIALIVGCFLLGCGGEEPAVGLIGGLGKAEAPADLAPDQADSILRELHDLLEAAREDDALPGGCAIKSKHDLSFRLFAGLSVVITKGTERYVYSSDQSRSIKRSHSENDNVTSYEVWAEEFVEGESAGFVGFNRTGRSFVLKVITHAKTISSLSIDDNDPATEYEEAVTCTP